MTNKIMFFIGLAIVVIYSYFLLSIITSQYKTKQRNSADDYDLQDLDGMGNQGRVPNKKPKNRA
ncbi:MAG: hypothetical protein DBW73_04570 [Flavobacteriales bacterium]|jgi:hypothetical protein|nr:MAG: hypothetical protein DBW73_04570 [Flavobacteriales bacterium]RPF73450.1 MAG: hypothetical protein CBE45_000630 [Thiotrichales bacterium TMED285]|tara:strand:+ start:1438 stop:1629 length:192 start_codon:yes stop_codon:yes gene_type:complete